MKAAMTATRRVIVVALAATLVAATTWGSVDARSVPQTPAPGSTLLVLGDSLTWGANYFARAQSRLRETGEFETVVYDGWWSRRIGGIASTKYSGVNTYKQLVAGGVRPSAVLVALGTNDVFFSGKRAVYETLIRELMNTIGDVPVVWMNVHRVESATTARRSQLFNTTLQRVLAEYPRATPYDWVSLATSGPRFMAADKIHQSASGYELRTMAYLEIAGTLALRVSETTITTVPAPTTVVP
jgi:lysophospholipase L1-like esterase